MSNFQHPNRVFRPFSKTCYHALVHSTHLFGFPTSFSLNIIDNCTPREGIGQLCDDRVTRRLKEIVRLLKRYRVTFAFESVWWWASRYFVRMNAPMYVSVCVCFDDGHVVVCMLGDFVFSIDLTICVWNWIYSRWISLVGQRIEFIYSEILWWIDNNCWETVQQLSNRELLVAANLDRSL